jgi:drug/metabolite transporter (DMT)-like permease
MAPTAEDRERPTTTAVWAALVTVYIVWGTTYFSIRIVNQTLPALVAASVRFLIAGSLMFVFTVRRGDVEGDRPGRRQWIAAAIIGTALLLGGNGGVVWSERTTPSGLVALIIALVPLWMALLDAVVLGRRPRPQVALGLLMGFAGAALLVGTSASGRIPLIGLLFAVGASISWAAGSLYARSAPLPRRPFVGIGMEMLCGGVGLLIAGVLAGDLGRIHPERISLASVIALSYLIVFGSFAGFASYVWLLRNARTSLVSTYAYVNPVVAVFLGWAFLDESISVRTVIAGAIVLAAVAIIIATREERPTPEAASGGEPAEEGGNLGERDLALEGSGDAEHHRLPERRGGDLQPDG